MKSVPTARAIGKLLLGIGLFAAATAVATDTASIDQTNSMLDGAAEIERCSVSHEGRYRDGRYRKTLRYYDFDVRVTSNCVYARMECLVRYRTLVYEPSYAGSQTGVARTPWWQSSYQALILEPGEDSRTVPLGPTRRHAGSYEINCQRIRGS